MSSPVLLLLLLATIALHSSHDVLAAHPASARRGLSGGAHRVGRKPPVLTYSQDSLRTPRKARLRPKGASSQPSRRILAAAQLSRVEQQQVSHLPGGIPRIIHQMFLPNSSAIEAAEASGRGIFRRDWRRSCKVHNPHWQHVFWDEVAAEALLSSHYPWFLDIFRSMTSLVVKSDALRPFILHRYGGVYLDADIECFGSLDEVFKGHSLVLQAQDNRTLNNGQMASVANHPLWVLMQQRALSKCKDTVGKRLDNEVVMAAVGPWALTEEYRRYMSLPELVSLPGQLEDQGLSEAIAACASTATCDVYRVVAPTTTVRVYAPKQWFEACTWDDLGCLQLFAECSPFLRALVTAQQETRAMLQHTPALATTTLRPASLLMDMLKHAKDPWTDAAKKVLVSEERRQVARCLHTWHQVVGAHQFSGSWMNSGSSRPESHRDSIRKASVQGLANFFRSAGYFTELTPAPTAVEANSSRPLDSAAQAPSGGGVTTGGQRDLQAHAAHLLTSSAPAWLAPVLMPLHSGSLAGGSGPASTMHLAGRVGAGRRGCHLFTVVVFPTKPQTHCCRNSAQQEFQAGTLTSLAAWAASAQCTLSVLSNLSPETHPALAQAAGLPYVQLLPTQPLRDLVHNATALTDPGSSRHWGQRLLDTVSQALVQWRQLNPTARLTLLHLSLPGPWTWLLLSLMNKPPNKGLLDVKPRLLLLESGVVTEAHGPLLYPAHQHLYQELGYLGLHHQTLTLDADSHLGQHHRPGSGRSKRTGRALRIDDVVVAGVGHTTGAAGQEEFCLECFAASNAASERNSSVLLPPLRLGFVLQRYLHRQRRRVPKT